MKKLFALSAMVLAGSALFAFAGCAGGGSQLSSGGMGGGAGADAEAGATNAYALGAVTAASLLTEGGVLSGAALSSDAADGMKEDVKGFSDYFEVLDAFLNDGALNVTAEDVPNGEYSTRLTVEGVLPDGEKVSYTRYYTETEAFSHEETEEDEHKTRVAYSLEGEMEMEGVVYELTGYRMSETETEGREQETSEELWIMARDPARAGSYVRMDVEMEEEQEGGEEEHSREFVYRVYRDGKLTEQTSVEFETEDERGERETEYEVTILKEGKKSRFEVEREEKKNGASVIEVKYSGADGSGTFTIVRRADGTYLYEFEDGSRFEDGFHD